MIFCGQCGLQLAPGSTRCPRCGAAVEPAGSDVENIHVDDPTVASQSFFSPDQSKPANQQPLVLRPEAGNSAYNYNTQATEYEATSRVEAPNYGTRAPTNTPMNASYPGYPAGGTYPGQANYPDYGTQQGAYPQGTGYQQPYTDPHAQQRAAARAKGRTAAMVIIFIGLILILSAIIILIVQHNAGTPGASNGGSSLPPVTQQGQTQTPGQQASSVIQQHYSDVNNKNYQAAYNLWKTPPGTLATFSNGYKNTQHDDVTIDNTQVLQDGTVKVTVTVNATETASTGTKQSTYKGYYTVGPQSDGSWKILQGMLQKQ